MRVIAKRIISGVFLVLAFPLALLSGFGRVESLYLLGAQISAGVPGLPGDYFRNAFYRLTLESCHPESRIQFGSFFAHPQARIEKHVYIGAYCVLGRTSIGERTQIGSGVQILSGARQHGRDAEGRILSSDAGHFTTVRIGADCWIGAQAILMADIGEKTTIGAGSVVTKPIPPRSIAYGVPAKVKS